MQCYVCVCVVVVVSPLFLEGEGAGGLFSFVFLKWFGKGL